LNRILVVVPTYNEKENVGPLVRELLALRPDLDVWIADDGSPDGTGEAVRQLMPEFPGRVDLVDGGAKRGRGAAVMASFTKGLADPRYDVFFEMDADFSHHPREIPKFMEKLEADAADMVIGSRYIPGGGTSEWGFSRTHLSGLANKYIRIATGMPLHDFTGGYRAYRRPVLEAADFERIRVKGYAVHGETAYQAWVHGFRLVEVPIHFRNRARDLSKLTLREVYMALINFSLLRFRYGFRPRRRPRPEGALPEPNHRNAPAS
jgi:dolichol-phosphate mannosyltransferase